MILFYTVCTPDEDALFCAKMAKDSVLRTMGPVDFLIVGSEEKKYPTKENILFCPLANNNWIGNIRYSKNIFELNYERFIYIDSDILWFAKYFELSKNSYSRENVSISNPYFCSYWDCSIPKETKGVNSGFFSVDKKTGIELSDFFFKHISKYPNSTMIENGKLEQSTFNLYLYKKGYEGWQDKSEFFIFSSDENSKFEENKNFHFNKYQSKMNKKQKMMKDFLSNNKIT